MAQKVTVTLVDDLTGRKADETVVFGLDGKSYEIDLSDKNAQTLRDALAEYVKAGRKTGRISSGRGKSRSTGSGSSDTSEVRAWAKKNGYDVNERGRIPADIREAYEKATA